jgi:glyoxylase-like metal-dependent hydrolase (beta-lactamase superfamily II)
MPDAPSPANARLDVLLAGSVAPNVVSTCSLITDGAAVIVVDPGLAPSQEAILGPLREAGFGADAVTDVVISHHHPDHALNVALFPNARVHDHWAVYDFSGRWDDVECEGRAISPSVSLIRTPGHTEEDLSTVALTEDGTVVCTHLWWTDAGPAEDPYAPDPAVLHASRRRVLELADLIVPGHGEPFAPSDRTPG